MPTQKHIFEETTLVLDARIVSGAHQGTATFKLLRVKDQKELGSQQVEISTAWLRQNEKAKVSFDLPAVEDAEDTYQVETKIEYDGKTYDGNTIWTVWPQRVTFETTAEGGQDPFPLCPWVVTQGQNQITGSADTKGVWTFELPRPAAFEAVPKAPVTIVQWDQETGRVRKAQVKRNYQFSILRPVVASANESASGGSASGGSSSGGSSGGSATPAIKQHVNRESQAKGHDGCGASVDLLIGVEGDPDKGRHDRTAAPGDPVFMKVTFHKHPEQTFETAHQARRTMPGIWLEGVPQSRIKAGANDGEYTIETGLNRDSLLPLTLKLGQVGGDRVTIAVGSTSSCEDASISFENWRSMAYQVSRPPNLTTPDLARAQGSLAEVFIDFQALPEKTIEPGSGPDGSWIPGSAFGLSDDPVLVIGPHNSQHFHDAYFSDEPGHCHVVLAQAMFAAGPQFMRFISLTVSAVQTVEFPGQGSVFGIQITGADVGPGICLLPVSLLTGKRSWSNASWSSTATEGDQVGKGGSIDVSIAVAVAWADHESTGGQLTIRLPDDAKAVVEAGVPISVSWSIMCAYGPLLGMSDNAHPNWLVVDADVNADRFNDTICHEVGHTLRMTMAPGLSIPGIGIPLQRSTKHGWATHPYWYDSTRGHVGHHCAHGIAKGTYDDTTKPLTGLAGTCLMYGEGDPKQGLSQPSFCPACACLIVNLDVPGGVGPIELPSTETSATESSSSSSSSSTASSSTTSGSSSGGTR